MNPLECNCKWHFAKQSEASQDIGPNNAAFEHFTETPYPSLIREAIQNSLDVVRDKTKPVIVKFVFDKIRAKTFEGFYDLRKHIDGVIRLYGRNAKKEYEPMLQNFDKVIGGQKQLYFIKVSDYNTIGMDYEEGNVKSPMYAFIRSEGVTSKVEESSGGSFGFGKSAYFMMSPIHAIMVSTMTEKGKCYFEGAARLCTHLAKDAYGNDVKYQHYGYYDNQEGKCPISNVNDIPNRFIREEPGTDIFIMGVDSEKEKQDCAYNEMVEAALRHFWLAIMHNKLIVEIGNVVINAESLDNLMREHHPELLDRTKSGESYNPRPYYETVKNQGKSKDFVRVNEHLPLLGDVCLYVWKNKDARDGVIHMRKQRMFIFRSRSYSSSYGYFAVFLCSGEIGNKMLQSVEDPSHRKWEAKRNSKNGKTIMAIIEEFMSRSLQNIFESDRGGPLGVTGLEDYLFVPEELVATDREEIEDNPFFGEPAEEIQEEGTSPISVIDPPTPTISNERKESIGKVVTVSISRGSQRKSENSLGGHQRIEGKQKRKGTGNSPDHSAFSPDENEAEGEFLENIPVHYRVIAENKQGKMIHSIIIHSDYDVERGQIEIVISGEDNDEIIDIASSSQGTPNKNIVSNLRLYKDYKNTVELQFADQMKHAIKLTAYEFK